MTTLSDSLYSACRKALQRSTTTLLAMLFAFIVLPAAAQTGSWHHYLAYGDVQQIERADEGLFVRASNNLYYYSLNDQSITTFDRLNGLHDAQVQMIKWCGGAHRLVAVYANGNIDLIAPDGTIVNESSIYRSTATGSRTLHRIAIEGRVAYLCMGFQVVKLLVDEAQIAETYTFGSDVWNAMVEGNWLYVNTASHGVRRGKLTDNLLNPNNWQQTDRFPESIYDPDRGDTEEYLPLVGTLTPGGPHYNHFNQLWFQGGTLYGVGGGWYDGDQMHRPAAVQMMDSEGQWTRIDRPMTVDATSVAIDPDDAQHLFVSTCGRGLYEYRNGEMVRQYTAGNSLLATAVAGNNDYVRVDGLFFDQQQRLWMSNSESPTPLLRLSKDGTMEAVAGSALYYNEVPLTILRRPLTDRNHFTWMVNSHHLCPSLLRINTETDEMVRHDVMRNQNGDALRDIYSFNALAEDAEGNLWTGTNQGPLLLTPQQQADPDLGFTQIIVARNDGSGYGDYLLSGIDITCIAIDGGNRKWIGTASEGVYVVSADNQRQEAHFTTDNSPLLANQIESIAIDGLSGRVYIGTENGLCAYDSDATTPADEMEKGSVYAYPNPVRPEYTGLITVRGLTMDADVRIVSSSGRLIRQGRSRGGTFTWDGCDRGGQRVASGVYHVLTATKDGKRGTVCRIAIIR